MAEEVEGIASETLDTIDKTLDILEDGVQYTEQVVRNNPLVVAGAFFVGIGIGGIIAWKISEKRTMLKYESIMAEEIDAAKRFYKRLAKEGEFSSPESTVEALGVEKTESDAAEALKSYQGVPENAVQPVTPYNRVEEVVTPVVEVEKVEVTNNVFVESRTDPRDWDYRLEIADREANPGRPYVISFDEFNENSLNHEQSTLAYYAEDDTLVDERDQPIDNVDYTIGDDSLTRFGHGSNDGKIVYVRNENISMDFEVIRSEGSYSREVLGILPPGVSIRHSHRRASRKFRGTDE